jgi:hypothetical protein
VIVGYNVFNLLMTNYTETPTNDNGLTFKEWLRLADRAVSAVCGLGLDDLPDGPSWDAWNDDEAPADYASTMLYDAGFDDQ